MKRWKAEVVKDGAFACLWLSMVLTSRKRAIVSGGGQASWCTLGKGGGSKERKASGGVEMT